MRSRTPMSAALAMTAFVGIIASTLVSGPAALATPAADTTTDAAPVAAPTTGAATDEPTAAPTEPASEKTPTPEAHFEPAQSTPSPAAQQAPASETPTAKPDTSAKPTEGEKAAPTSTIALSLEVAKDGNGPFSKSDEPGGDTGDSNGIIRTLDTLTYRVSVSSNGAASSNERFTLTAPTGTSWVALPSSCTGAGSGITGQQLTCNLGTIPEGQVVATPVALKVSADLGDGDTIAVDAEATADNAENGPVSATSPSTTVSAAARYNLSKDLVASQLKADVIGPDGSTRGVQIVYPISVDWQPLEASQGLLGFEKSAGPMRFVDDISQITGDLPSGAVLFNADRPACGINEVNELRFSGIPGGRGGGDSNVADSGQLDCTQSAPGENVDVTITGTVTDPNQIPTKGLGGSTLTGGKKNYVVTGYISFWMPYLPEGSSVVSKNTYQPLHTTSISGAQNFPGSTEPTSDNTAQRNLTEYAPGNGSKTILQVADDGTVRPGSAGKGDPWVTAGQKLRSNIGASNPGLRPLDAVLCDTFDRNTQRITKVGGRYAAVTASSTYKIEYAAYDMTSPAAGNNATCDDSDGPWFSSPDQVPGGPAAVGAVRATTTLTGGRSAALYTYMEVTDSPAGTRVFDFGHLKFGTNPWRHNSADPTLGAGPLADSVLVTENQARIAKKIIDDGSDASDTPDKTTVVLAGDQVDYALYPSLTNGNANGQPSTVTVTDVLPVGTSYVPGSASATPTVEEITTDDGQTQQLTWVLEDVTPNTPIAPITYTVIVSALAPEGPLTNDVVIASPSDRSEASSREAERSVRVLSPGGIGVEKAATHPVVVTGDELEWTLGYTNRDSTAVRNVDLIDVLPYAGDGRQSNFHGTATLSAPVTVDAGAGESVRYTSADPSTVSMDAAHPSNQEGGATRWCTEGEFGQTGCPANLTEVTAFRIDRTEPVAPGQAVTHTVTLRTDGQQNADRYTNRFGLRASNLALPVQSNPATIRVVAGAIGDQVWVDSNGNGVQDDDERLPDVQVQLSGTDDRGDTVRTSTRTDSDGRYGFDGLRPGDYTVQWTAPDGYRFTTARVGDDRAVDSDADTKGISNTVTLAKTNDDEGFFDAVTRDNTIDAGLVKQNAPVDPVTPVDPETPTTPEKPGLPGKPDTSHGRNDTEAPQSHQQPTTSSAGAADRPGIAHAQRGTLAFTGSEGLALTVGIALLLMLAGGLTFAANRNRARKR